MSEIALYDLLRRIPEVSNDEAKAAVADVASASQVATKSDIKDMATKSDIREIKTELKYMQWFIAFGFSITIAILKLL